MRYTMKSLKHNGIYVPPYEHKNFSIRIKGQSVKLSPKTEQMALAWVRKEQSPASPPDKIFYRNFMQDFLQQLALENPSVGFLQQFRQEYARTLNDTGFEWSAGDKTRDAPIDFSQIRQYLLEEQSKKQSMTKEEKKKLAAERKRNREILKEKLGYAEVDRHRIEIANWTAEPSCIFAGRGDHPKRGKWKEGPREEDITLNLDKASPRPAGNWKCVVWEPDKMYLAKWHDKLSGKIKYVWFSDSAFLKQEREKEKYKKAEILGKKIPTIEQHILENLNSEDWERRKTATVCWLILAINLRVGDEKDPGEADTVGAITLRPEHITIEGNKIRFDFLGKDAVRWVSEVHAPVAVTANIKRCKETCKEYLFEGIDSKRVSRFLSEKMDGLTAKVFRTWRCTQTIHEYLDKCNVVGEDEDYVKKFHAKMANLQAAKVANHKRKIPQNYRERIAKREAAFQDLGIKLTEKTKEGKKTDALRKRLAKTELDIELAKQTEEYNLGTSLKSYIDPMVFVRWADKVDFSLDKLYSKTLRNKFSWALKKNNS